VPLGPGAEHACGPHAGSDLFLLLLLRIGQAGTKNRTGAAAAHLPGHAVLPQRVLLV